MDIYDVFSFLKEALYAPTHIGILVLATLLGLFTEFELGKRLGKKYINRGYPPSAEESAHDLATKVGGYAGIFAAGISNYYGYNALVFPVVLYLLSRPLGYLWIRFSVHVLRSRGAVTVAYVFLGAGTGAMPTAIYYAFGLAINLLIWQFFYS